MNYVIVGDLNARFGIKVNELVADNEQLNYNPIDKGENDNGKKVLSICEDHNLVVINNLSTNSASFTSALTYRMRKMWKSELDICITSKELIPTISFFHVNQDITFPSNHAPVSVCFTFPKEDMSLHELTTRSEDIGTYPTAPKALCKRPIRFNQVDIECLKEKTTSAEPPLVNNEMDINSLVEEFTSQIYDILTESKAPRRGNELSHDSSLSRWERIMKCEDDGLLWKAIDWKGQFDPGNSNGETVPSESQFQNHLENLLNPTDERITTNISAFNTKIPILDDELDVKEVKHVIERQVKPNKSCGPDGINPGVFKFLPGQWITFLSLLLNVVFVAGYPLQWTSVKLIMLFKKGLRLDCNNYRGISIMNAAAKIYDYVLNNRLILWYKPCREQAGAQPKRGCIEHIVTLRLMISVFMQKRLKLFVVFVDFTKAYDLVPRSKLFDILVNLGCGATMLAALIAMYTSTTSFLGSTTITSTIGVRQGSPTSCYLFVIFVDVLILMFKSKCVPENILGWLHSLMLMDDTVIFATSREKMVQKLKILDDYCINYGMRINESKTKFMTINGKPVDKVSFQMSKVTVKHCDSYVYLGAIFTADGCCASSLRAHLTEKNKELNKLLIFFAVNYDAPFSVKKRVLDAAFTSSILYGCESWLKVPLKPVEQIYMKAVRALLGVRSTTPANLCLVEAGINPALSLVKSRQQKFFEKMLTSRSDIPDDPLMHSLNITKELNKSMWTYIDSVLKGGDIKQKEFVKIKDSIINAKPSATKFRTYITLNPELAVHNLYKPQISSIPDYLRITFTRYRLSSHRLRVEMGRWSRTPREQRTCQCGGGIQDEYHIFVCTSVRDLFIGSMLSYNSPADLFTDTNVDDLHMLHHILDRLDHLCEEQEEAETSN